MEPQPLYIRLLHDTLCDGSQVVDIVLSYMGARIEIPLDPSCDAAAFAEALAELIAARSVIEVSAL